MEALTDEAALALEESKAARQQLYQNLLSAPDGQFAVGFLQQCIRLRRQGAGLGLDLLMFAGYLVALHGSVADSLLIWQAKTVDFDTYCGFDIQLVAFAGALPTIHFLAGVNTEEGREAASYAAECHACGDFDDLQEYFSPESLPWWF